MSQLKEMFEGIAYSPPTKLAQPLNSAATQIVVEDADVFPDAPGIAVIGIDENAETVIYRTKIGDTLGNVERGIQGEAREWPGGSIIARNFTWLDHEALMDNINTLDDGLGAVSSELVDAMLLIQALNKKTTIVANADPTEETPGAVSQFYVNADNKKLYVCADASEDAYTWLPVGSGGGGGGLLPQVHALVEPGAVVTATRGQDVVSVEAPDGNAVLELPDYGTWTVESDRDVGVSEIDVDTVKIYRRVLSAKIVGVEWDYNFPSTTLKRLTPLNDPFGYVTERIDSEPVAAIGTGTGSSPMDSLMPWMGMDEWNVINNELAYKRGESGFSRTLHDTVVGIPAYWYKVECDAVAGKMWFYISDAPVLGFELHPAFDRGDGVVRDAIYCGKYGTTAGYTSKSGLAHLVSITRTAARTGSHQKGAPWWMADYAARCAISSLYLLEHADWDCQTKIGQGRTASGNSSAVAAGQTDTMIYHTGRAAGTDNAVLTMYRWIEKLYGNTHDWCDGINFNNRRAYVCLNPQDFDDGTSQNYTDTGIDIATSSGAYITKLGFSPSAPWTFLPTAVGGSSSTYIPDHVESATGWRALSLGGHYSNGLAAGLFNFRAECAASYSAASLGARLLFLP